MAKFPVSLTQTRLKELLYYEPETGIFTWRRHHGIMRPGDRAGTINPEGYQRIQIDHCLYQGSTLAWLYMTGQLPSRQVDHRDLDTSNDQWSNLRLATQTQNKANSRTYKNNRLGVKGVRLHRNGQFEARVRVKGKLQYLGCFRTLAEAKSVYDRASEEFFGEFARSS